MVADETPDTPKTSQRQALAEAISTAMSKGLEPLLAVKESKRKPLNTGEQETEMLTVG